MNEIRDSWNQNADEWIQILENSGIESRKVTNGAIVKAITDYKPHLMLDLGCGEGWLTRKVNDLGINAMGIDGTPALIEQAQKLHPGGKYQVLAYEDILAGTPLPGNEIDMVVANFCLYQKEETSALLQQIIPQLVAPKWIIIQTLHPYGMLQNQLTYTNQWMQDSWKGLAGNFVNPHRWYYRTFEGWAEVFDLAGLKVIAIREPISLETGLPLSVIFVLTR